MSLAGIGCAWALARYGPASPAIAAPGAHIKVLQSLPVDALLPDLLRTLAERGVALLQAPPGAGKTTRVPPALLDAPWRDGRRILYFRHRHFRQKTALWLRDVYEADH